MSITTATPLALVASIPDIGMYPLKYVFETLALRQTPDVLWLEFGVWSGGTINYIAQHASGRVYGFDSFEGLPETWRPGYEKGEFNRGGALPTVRSNVHLVKGWFSDTLPGFLSERPGQQVAFLHLDADLYSSTIFVLEALKDRLDGCVVVFDELVNYDGFDGDTGELRAWHEFVSKYEVDYEWIGMNGRVGAGDQPVALRIRTVRAAKDVAAQQHQMAANPNGMPYDFIEIGTSHFDTLLQDFVTSSATNNAAAPVRGLSVDPIQYYLDCLPNVPGVTKVRAAVSDRDGSCDVHYIPEAAVDAHGLPWWLKGCNSINCPHPQHVQQGLLDLVQVQTVPMISCARLFREHHVRSVHFLKIDTEGHDCVILRSLHAYLLPLAAEYRPGKIQFESNGLVPTAEVEQVIALFTTDLGYTVTSRGGDTVMETLQQQQQLAITQPLYREMGTLHPQVTGFMDRAVAAPFGGAAAAAADSYWTVELVGWAFQLGAPACARPVRFRSTDGSAVFPLEAVRRDDVVAAHYRGRQPTPTIMPAIAWCGWNQKLPPVAAQEQRPTGKLGTLEMQMGGEEEGWTAFMDVAV